MGNIQESFINCLSFLHFALALARKGEAQHRSVGKLLLPLRLHQLIKTNSLGKGTSQQKKLQPVQTAKSTQTKAHRPKTAHL
jgi:hypothetical protein